MTASVLVGVLLAVLIPLTSIGYRRLRGPPSVREKRAWLYVVSFVILLHSLIGIYDLATQTYYDVLPAIAGATVGACFVLVHYFYQYGSIGPDSAGAENGPPGTE